jgi:superfamily II DNA helicase RecQ
MKAGGIIHTFEYGFLVPAEILENISNKTFLLPISTSISPPTLSPTSTHVSHATIDGYTAREDHTVPSITHKNSPFTTINQPSTTLTKFLPSDDDIIATFSTNQSNFDAVSMRPFAHAELINCFGSEEAAHNAHEYLTSYIHIMTQGSPGLFKRNLSEYISMMTSKHNDPSVELILLSGKKWLQSDAANMDVRAVPVHHRNAMYLIGNSFYETDKDLLKGSTFVWSENVDTILSQFSSLINFSFSIKWPTLEPYLSKVQTVYIMTQEMDASQDPQLVTDRAATQLVNTNIIYGLLMEMLLEDPQIPNGPTLIYKYLAGATAKMNHNRDISLRNHNEISKHANALLRLLRHAMCSMYVRKSKDMARNNSTHQTFDSWANEVIRQMQVCHSIGHICRTIRTAREVDRKTPSKILKAFNDKTGELLVAGSQIHKSTWSVAIPTAVTKWDTHLFSLFPNNSPTSNLPLHWIFDLNNPIILSGEESYLSVGPSDSESIPLNAFLPDLPTDPHSGLSNNVKKAIYECWKYDLGCHAYFSCGASRGSEIKRLPDFKHSQFLWNSLRFQLRSKKNQTHGKNFNEQVDHWLPPSASRRSILCHHVLYPAIKAAGFHIPDSRQVNPALSEMFAHVMNLPKPLNPKINRDFISVLTDYIAPSSLAKTSTTEQMASTFHHSHSIHNRFYSAETFKRDKDGKMLPGPLSVAHQIWEALGEDVMNCDSIHERPVLQQVTLSRSDYSQAAKRAFHNKAAQVKNLQYQAIHHAACKDITKHAFVFMGCGTGKSGIYNLLLLGAYLHMAPVPKSMVISPHNSLLSMHKLQSQQYFRGSNLVVASLLPVDVQQEAFPMHFDLLFISVHAFNDLMTGFREIVLSWQVENIFVDEYHNVVGELFRFSSSWQSIRLTTSLNAKIMLLSATTEANLIQYTAEFMGLNNYDVIGSSEEYNVPNVTITLTTVNESVQRDTLLNKVVQYCQKVIQEKRNSTFKIHAITMTRRDASDLSDKLNHQGLSSMWLTSSLPPIQKAQLLQRWEENSERVLVSTFTDGIDNSLTENVIIVGATYSLYNLVQAIGRIRPNRQTYSRAGVHIFHSPKYFRTTAQDITDSISRAIGGQVFPQENREIVKQYYSRMFHISGYKTWIGGKSCLRKTLYDHFNIKSQDCKYCSNCVTHNIVNKTAIQANKVITTEDRQRVMVCNAVQSMLTACLVCSRQDCNGIQCFPAKQNRCFCCHVVINKQTFHKSSHCPADTSAKKIDTQGQSCPSCFMTFSKDMPYRGTTEEHMNKKCPHMKRIKRVLLYGVEQANNPGTSARNVLAAALSNPTYWYSVMAMNINKIKTTKP